MNRDRLSRVVYGMRASQVYLETEKERLEDRDLLAGHLAMRAIDDYERPYSTSGNDYELAGFTIGKTKDDHVSQLFLHPYSMRPEGLIERAVKETFSEYHHLFTNASVDTGGYITVRGIHANDLLDHPYLCACFGLVDNSVDLLLSVRLSALSILEVPSPSDETLSFMRATMEHNKPHIGKRLAEHNEWLNSIMRISGKDQIKDLRHAARCTFYSPDDNLTETDASMISQSRRRFLDRYPGAEIIFGPFPEGDLVLTAIRNTVHTERNFQMVDSLIDIRIGEENWSDFLSDPGRFCSERTEKRSLTDLVDSDGTSLSP